MTSTSDFELMFIREFSTARNLIGRSAGRPERRERVRRAIYENHRADVAFYGEGFTYAEAFRRCYGEQLDRRAVLRPTELDDEDDDEDLASTSGEQCAEFDA